jgi:hypothetical protein
VDLARILKELWHRRLLVAVGLVPAFVIAISTAYHISGFPPKVTSKSIEYGAASTQVLVDARLSPLTDLKGELSPLAMRAEVYTNLVMTEPVRAAIARDLGRPSAPLVIEGRSPNQLTRSAREPTAEQRSNALRSETDVLRALFVAEPNLPVISIYTQGPTAKSAVALADAAASGLTNYVTALEANNRIPADRRVRISQLGQAQGGTVNEGAGRVVMVLAFALAFIGWCMLVLIGSSVLHGWREDDRLRERASRETDASLNGFSAAHIEEANELHRRHHRAPPAA